MSSDHDNDDENELSSDEEVDDDDEEEEEEGTPTDCCGNTNSEDAETCPDCDHVCCESCQVSASRGLCWCEHSLRGAAHSDQTTSEGRNFLRRAFGYRGPFKPLAQARMEQELVGRSSFLKPSMQPRGKECAYYLCNAPPSGWSRDRPPDRTPLTDDTLSQFVVCEKCRSVAYCGAACRDADACTPFRDRWDGGAEEKTHADVCEPYRDNDTLPYASAALRDYKREFGRYPHPLGLGGADDKKE